VRKSDGEVFALLLILYPIGRFLLELIRQDELGQFGTDLTISQWVSFGTILVGISFLVYVRIAGYRSGSNPPLTGSMAD
jgi:phosphatidylglycerol:prolipoprotein diacylglycerol transferase